MNLGLPVLWIGYLTCIIVLDSFLGMRGYNSYRSPYYRNFGYNNMGGYLGSYLNRRYNYWHLNRWIRFFFQFFLQFKQLEYVTHNAFFLPQIIFLFNKRVSTFEVEIKLCLFFFPLMYVSRFFMMLICQFINKYFHYFSFQIFGSAEWICVMIQINTFILLTFAGCVVFICHIGHV